MLKNYKKIIITTLVLGVMNPFLIVRGEEVDLEEKLKPVFKDISDNIYTDAIIRAVENDIISGSDGKVGPDEHLTRAEMAAIISRAFNNQKGADISSYTDVSEDDWFKEDMEKAVYLEILKGYDNKLNPLDKITREEALVAISRAFRIMPNPKQPEGYHDIEHVSSWARPEVYTLIHHNYLDRTDGYVYPKEEITRAEFIKVLDNIVSLYFNENKVYTEEDIDGLEEDENGKKYYKGNAIINKPNVVLKDIKIDGDLILAEGIEDGEIVLDGVEVTGRTVMRAATKFKTINNTRLEILFTETREPGKSFNVNIGKGSVVGRFTLRALTTVKGDGEVISIITLPGSENSEIKLRNTTINTFEGVTGVKASNGEILPPGTSHKNYEN